MSTDSAPKTEVLVCTQAEVENANDMAGSTAGAVEGDISRGGGDVKQLKQPENTAEGAKENTANGDGDENGGEKPVLHRKTCQVTISGTDATSSTISNSWTPPGVRGAATQHIPIQPSIYSYPTFPPIQSYPKPPLPIGLTGQAAINPSRYTDLSFCEDPAKGDVYSM